MISQTQGRNFIQSINVQYIHSCKHSRMFVARMDGTMMKNISTSAEVEIYLTSSCKTDEMNALITGPLGHLFLKINLNFKASWEGKKNP